MENRSDTMTVMDKSAYQCRSYEARGSGNYAVHNLYVNSYRSLRRYCDSSVMTRETIQKENERRADEAIPTIKAEAKMMRSATNSS